MNPDHDRRFSAIEGLMESFQVSKPRAERISRFVKRTLDIPCEVLEQACRNLELAASRPPHITDLRQAAATLRRGADCTTEDDRKIMDYHLERYSDADYHMFRDRFGVAPTRDLFARHGVQPHADVTFAAPPREQAERERAAAAREAREAFERARFRAAL